VLKYNKMYTDLNNLTSDNLNEEIKQLTKSSSELRSTLHRIAKTNSKIAELSSALEEGVCSIVTDAFLMIDVNCNQYEEGALTSQSYFIQTSMIIEIIQRLILNPRKEYAMDDIKNAIRLLTIEVDVNVEQTRIILDEVGSLLKYNVNAIILSNILFSSLLLFVVWVLFKARVYRFYKDVRLARTCFGLLPPIMVINNLEARKMVQTRN